MADKITLANFTSFQNDTSAVATINNNNALVTTAFDNTLSRDGTSPNQMGANLDMNNFQILNLPAPGSANSPARLVDVGKSVSTPVVMSPNDSVATSLTGVGPTGSHTTVQEWLTILNPSGVTRYIPCF